MNRTWKILILMVAVAALALLDDLIARWLWVFYDVDGTLNLRSDRSFWEFGPNIFVTVAAHALALFLMALMAVVVLILLMSGLWEGLYFFFALVVLAFGLVFILPFQWAFGRQKTPVRE